MHLEPEPVLWRGEEGGTFPQPVLTDRPQSGALPGSCLAGAQPPQAKPNAPSGPAPTKRFGHPMTAPTHLAALHRDYQRVEAAIRHLERHTGAEPELAQLANDLGISLAHLRQILQRWAGVSPQRFLQFLTARRVQEALKVPPNLLKVAGEAGLGGAGEAGLGGAGNAGLGAPERSHGFVVNLHAMTPAQARAKHDRFEVRWGLHPSPFGTCLLGATPEGIAFLSFASEPESLPGAGDPPRGGLGGPPGGAAPPSGGAPPPPVESGHPATGSAQRPPDTGELTPGPSHPPEELRRTWPEARFLLDPETTGALVRRIFEPTSAELEPTPSGGASRSITLLVRGTNFQIRVWQALLRIPPGRVATYGDLAEAVATPRGARAVGSAVGRNHISWIIPCHRVIRGTGVLGEYRWGSARKKAMLGWEAARHGGL